MDRKLLEQLVAVVSQMQSLCAELRQNTELAKENALLLKNHTAHMTELLVERGIDKLPEVLAEKALIDQTVRLLEEREADLKSLQRLQEALDTIREKSAEAAS